MSSRYSVIVISCLLALLVGCVSAPKPMPIDSTATIKTLTSSVALSVKAGEKSLSGRGYLIMHSPDRFRLVILSPFGTPVAEMFLNGDRLLYVASSQNVAYQGQLSELPDAPVLQGWRLLRWTTESVIPESKGQTSLSRQRPGGEWETIDFDSRGLVLKKSIDGDVVRYEGYQSVDGVPVPTLIEITDRLGITVKINLEDPEVNAPLDDKTFLPALEGVRILPLQQFPSS